MVSKITADKWVNMKRVHQEPVFRDGDFIYSPEIVGTGYWMSCKNADYGTNADNNIPFQMQTMPQAVRFANYALLNTQKETYAISKLKQFIDSLTLAAVTGDTLFLWTPKNFVWGIDYPDQGIVSQLGVDDQKLLAEIEGELENKLGRLTEKGVVFSEDRMVRRALIKSEKVFHYQTAAELAINPINIVVSGSLENAKLSAEIAVGRCNGNGFVYSRNLDLGRYEVCTPMIHCIDGDSFYVSASHPKEASDGHTGSNKRAFGMQKLTNKTKD